MHEWFDKLPKEAGLFWFYGYKFKDDQESGRDKEWGLVRSLEIQNGFMTVMDGAFMFDFDCIGHFCRVVLPEVPDAS